MLWCSYANTLPELGFAPHWRIVGHDGFAPDYANLLFPDVQVPGKFRLGCVPPTDDELRQLAKVCGLLVSR